MPLLERLGGPQRKAQILARAGIFEIPDGTSMIAEGDAARVHRQLRIEEPELAPLLARHAGMATAEYIIEHRIPPVVQALLKALPAKLAAPLLAQAIRRHAWTFAGSGAFRVLSATAFEIENNPLVAGERSDTCLCHWHTAVFERLYQVLVAPDFTCRETTCCAQGAGKACHFELSRRDSQTESQTS